MAAYLFMTGMCIGFSKRCSLIGLFRLWSHELLHQEGRFQPPENCASSGSPQSTSCGFSLYHEHRLSELLLLSPCFNVVSHRIFNDGHRQEIQRTYPDPSVQGPDIHGVPHVPTTKGATLATFLYLAGIYLPH